jgi:hypothetical protein
LYYGFASFGVQVALQSGHIISLRTLERHFDGITHQQFCPGGFFSLAITSSAWQKPDSSENWQKTGAIETICNRGFVDLVLGTLARNVHSTRIMMLITILLILLILLHPGETAISQLPESFFLVS